MIRMSTPCFSHSSQHVVQWTQGYQTCFFSREDYQVYHLALGAVGRKFSCDIHAYLLMADCVQLLVTPRKNWETSTIMDSIWCRYSRYLKQKYKRQKGLLEGCYKFEPVEASRCLLTYYQEIEMSAVRFGLIDRPECYAWSSHSHNALGRFDPIISHHSVYIALGSTNEQRQKVYRGLFMPKDDEKLCIKQGKRTHYESATNFSSSAF